ncbi:papilin-like [Actinia tenebrosa]|uniref:Papilin-like n=1 Tax=Actinia tenebrosa TaxID=6105 RepID=A0A6P8IU41_ACTTE|nr:papilin-like [Actinia tenebrosa]
MTDILVLAVLILTTVANTAYSQSTSNTGCKKDRLRPNSCFYFMLKGYCTDGRYSAYMKTRCSSMCGYCCPDGTLSQLPFNQGCKDYECAQTDRLPLLTNVTTKKTCLQYYNDITLNSSYPWVKYYCENTFGWCCMDKKTFADGVDEKGCPYKLCYNVNSDEYCLNQTKTDSRYCDSALTRQKCAWTCKKCKAKKPTDCGLFGCCWNGVPALSPDYRDCQPCRDISSHLCNQFRHACLPIGQYRLREFALTRCPRTCNLCV